MVLAMAVSLGYTHSVLHSSSSPSTGHFTLPSKTANNCHRNLCSFKTGKKLNGAAVESLMAVKCFSTLVQPEKNSPSLTAVSKMSTESSRLSSSTDRVWNPRTAIRDQQGRFRSPRAARELALLILYEACVEGSDPVRLLERRVNMSNALPEKFDKNLLYYYDHMHFSGSPFIAETKEEARLFEMKQDEETSKEADILAAPLELVYNKFVLSKTRKILEAVAGRWDEQVGILDETIPIKWKDESAGRTLELCLLHMAMSEIVVLGTRHQVVINETIDLAKRFCDGTAPRVINGCLRSFVEKNNLKNEVPSQNLAEPQP